MNLTNLILFSTNSIQVAKPISDKILNVTTAKSSKRVQWFLHEDNLLFSPSALLSSSLPSIQLTNQNNVS